MDHNFQLPGSYKKWTWGLLAAGLIALLWGFIMYHPFSHPVHGEGAPTHDSINSTRFWAVLLQNSVYWLLTVNAGMFFICITTLAQGGWQVAMRRVPEAISSVSAYPGCDHFRDPAGHRFRRQNRYLSLARCRSLQTGYIYV